ncbi:ABC transporter permease [Massilibacterium senegalense]|uniref:ABC transporter permease n=1 Tax=Massilibacterium senegalense TaxID=1632858 RepID=UPI0007834250|nr:ABC transporter permease [Massilibacterium senegalense]
MTKKLAIYSCLYLILLFFFSLFAPFISHQPYNEVNLTETLSSPSFPHWFGTDEVGRDILVRLLYGGRVSLLVALSAMMLSIIVGVVYGAISGYFGGWTDRIMMRILDGLLSIPSLLFMVMLQALWTPSIRSVIFVIGITSWMPLARLIRAEVMALKDEMYVYSAHVVGATSIQTFFRHILPQCFPTIIVMSTNGIGHAILSEATLSFFGIGIPSNEPSWGNMLIGAQNHILSGVWWTAFFPGLFIIGTVLSFVFIGDYLEDRLTLPHRKRKEVFLT